ncbi:MAG: NADH-quinone oxidoreductase subunit J [Magnetococcus sp. MYC-9]
MMVVDFIFYAFAAVTALAAVGVIASRNQVHSVLFLILTFFSTAALFVLLDAEFLAALLIMVYMGAVAVLFMFVVMMLDMEADELRQQALNHLPLGLAVGVLILIELVVVLSHAHGVGQGAPAGAPVSNTLAIGRILYTQYLYPFEVVSLLLLVALIGAVALTLRSRRGSGVKRQNIGHQLARTRGEAVELVQRQPGEGA